MVGFGKEAEEQTSERGNGEAGKDLTEEATSEPHTEPQNFRDSRRREV